MLEAFKKRMRRLERAPPGKRFQLAYEARKESGSPALRIAFVGIGVVVIAAGVIMLAIPGPGLVAIAVGGALLAQEFLWAAKGLDRLELFLRKWVRKLKAMWKKASLITRAAVVVAASIVAVGAAYLGYQWFIRR